MAKTDLSYLRYNVALYPISFEDNIPKDIYNKDIIESIRIYYRDQQEIMDAQVFYSNVIFDMVRPFLRKYGIHNPKSALTEATKTVAIGLLVKENLAKHYGSDEFGQVLFELRLKTSEFIFLLDNLSKANKKLVPILKGYIND